jgi:hypothetical protein
MKYVCERTCQIRKNGKIITVDKDAVIELDDAHPLFRVVGEGLDFATAGEEELMAADFDLEELKEYIKEVYGKNPRNRRKEKTVEMLLDCRYRALDEATEAQSKQKIEQVI